MNDLQKYFLSNQGNMIDKWEHYFDIYEHYFNKYRGKELVFVEIGVYQGGSLEMWRSYFGDKVKIYGIDINPECKKFESEQIKIIIGNQEDKDFLESLKNIIPQIDILLDDGGHTMRQQINTFEVLFEHIKIDGLYLCEDTHTSYWWEYQGGYRNKNSFVEYSKHLIDYLYAWYSKDRRLKVSNITHTLRAIHFYDSIVVFEKGKILEPSRKRTGKAILPDYYVNNQTFKDKILMFKNRIWIRVFG